MATPENLHKNIPNSQLHDPKDFSTAGVGTSLRKGMDSNLEWAVPYWQDSVLDRVDMALTPPSENDGDRYIIINLTSTVVHADWDGASENDIVEFDLDASAWVSVTPFFDMTARSQADLNQYYFDGTTWNDVIGSSGDVSQSGTSSDNQIAVFTADKTIEGNSDFTFDSTLNTFNINQFGTGSLNVSLGIAKMQMDSNPSTWQSYTHDSTTNTSLLELIRSRGTAASPSAVQSGDALGRANFKGYNTSSYIVGGLMEFNATETWSGSAQGTEFKVQTILTGATSLADRIVVDGSGDITLGNYKFDGDQTVGAGQDDYVLTYDYGTGLISLEAAAGGGSSLWTDDGGGKISYSASGAAAEIYETGFGNTYGTQVTIRRGFFMVGDLNTIGDNSVITNVDRSVVFGGNNTLGNVGNTAYSLIVGYNSTIEEGNYNISLGANNTINNTTDSGVTIGTGNNITGSNGIAIGISNTLDSGNALIFGNTVRAGDSSKVQVAVGNNFDVSHSYYSKGFYVEFGNGTTQRPSFGLVRASGLTDTQPLNMALGSDQALRNDGYGAASSGAGSGVFWHFRRSTTNIEPTTNFTDGVALYVHDRTAGKAGYMMKVEDGTQHFFGDFSAIGGDETDANANKTLTIVGTGTGSGTSSLLCEDSGGTTRAEVKDNGEASLGNYLFDSSATVGAGQDDYVLTYDYATGKIGLEASAGGGSSPLTTKGDIYTYSTADARLAVGSNGQYLIADSAEATGLKWGDAADGLVKYDEVTSFTTGSNLFDVNINESFAVGRNNNLGTASATTTDLAVFGNYCSVGNLYSSKGAMAFGYEVRASGLYAGIGGKNNRYETNYAGAGKDNDTTGQYSWAFGLNSTASGSYCFVFGNNLTNSESSSLLAHQLRTKGLGTTSTTSSLKTQDSLGSTTFEVQDDGVAVFNTFTVATLPSQVAGGFIYVSDETGGATMAFSDGTNWRRVQDRAVVA